MAASIGQNIRRLRERIGFRTQGAFARALNVPQPRLSDWENDRYGIPEVANLLKIAKHLGVSVDELLRGVDADYDQVTRDLPRHTDSTHSRLPPQERADEGTAAPGRVPPTARELAHTVQEAINRLVGVAAELERQAAETRGRESPRDARHRRSG